MYENIGGVDFLIPEKSTTFPSDRSLDNLGTAKQDPAILTSGPILSNIRASVEEAVAALAQSFSDALQKMPGDTLPDEMEVECGLSLAQGIKAWVVESAATASIRVKLSWNKQSLKCAQTSSK